MPQEISPLYRRLIGELQRIRAKRRVTLSQLDDMAGIPDGLASKAVMLHRNKPRGGKRPSNRVVGYDTLDEMLTAVAGRGYRIVILPPSTSTRQNQPTAGQTELQLRSGPAASPDQLSLPLSGAGPCAAA